MIRAFACALALVGCGLFAGDPPAVPAIDPAKVASEARVRSEQACKAYTAAVVAELIKADPRADMACANVVNVCTE